MKIEDFRKLCDAQERKELRKPEVLNTLTEQDINNKLGLSNVIAKFLEKFGEIDDDESRIFEKVLRRKFNVKGSGEKNDPFCIKSYLGAGSFLHFNCFFALNKAPNYFVKRMCHQNAYEFAKKSPLKCEIISGICYRKFPFLHSVILVDDYILDFNYDLAMSKDLYLNLFNFEILSIVKSDDIKVNLKMFNKQSKFLAENEITYGDVVFCYDELITILTNEKSCKTIVD